MYIQALAVCKYHLYVPDVFEVLKFETVQRAGPDRSPLDARADASALLLIKE